MTEKKHRERMHTLVDKAFVSFGKLTQEQKIIIGTSLLPVLADFIEDYPMKQLAKAQRNAIVKAIRHYDAFYMDGAPIDVVDQQANIQLWFRQMLEKEMI